MKTLFEHERMSLEDALDQTAASLLTYGADHNHWRIAFSGGKDSTATVAAVAHLVESGRVPRPATLGVLYADTRLELPNLQSAAMGILGELRRRGWDVRVVYPPLDKRFFVLMLGRGIPPSHSGFRWCTGALKVLPMALAMEEDRARLGEKLLLLTGMRVGESANRDRRIALSCGRNGGECGQGWYEETTPAEVADVLSPLLHWRTCHVWDWLMLHPKRHGFDCQQVASVYDQDAEGSANEVLSRTGCLVCPVASRDLALERTLAKPEWCYLAPLLRLRSVYARLTLAESRLRKNAERTKGGKLSANPMRLGPLTMESRRWGLAQVCRIEAEVNAEALRRGRPEVSLINDEELARIQELMESNTWPDKWTGDEPSGDELLPETFKDGTVQPLLFAGLEG